MTTVAQFEAVQLFTDFLASHPTDDDILSFRLPDRVDARVQHLVARSSAGILTPDEQGELAEYERLDAYAGLLKRNFPLASRSSQSPRPIGLLPPSAVPPR